MMNKSNLHAILTLAGSAPALHAGREVSYSSDTYRSSGLPKWARPKPPVERMVAPSSAEIQAWNAAVDKRKAERKIK